MITPKFRKRKMDQPVPPEIWTMMSNNKWKRNHFQAITGAMKLRAFTEWSVFRVNKILGELLSWNALLRLAIFLQNEIWENTTKKTLVSLSWTITTLKNSNTMQLIFAIETESCYSLQATNLSIGMCFTIGMWLFIRHLLQ